MTTASALDITAAATRLSWWRRWRRPTPQLPQAPTPDLRARRFLALAVACAQAASVTSVTTPVLLAGLFTLALALALREPPRHWAWRLALAVATVAAGVLVFSQYGKLFARDAGMALLFIFGPLKLVEARSSRDFMVVWSLGLMLYVTSFFENLGLAAALSVPLVVLIYVTALRLIDAPATTAGGRVNGNRLGQHLVAAAADLALGIPLAVMLFVLFPRATAPLWGRLDAQSARTGLSEEMQPGSIAKLILSHETAFRVEFDGARPPSSALYWRGPVLREFDGQGWRAGFEGLARGRGSIAPNTDATTAPAIDYVVTAERLDTRWLPTLEMPSALARGPLIDATVFASDAQQIGMRQAPPGALQYRAQSRPSDHYAAAAPLAGSAEWRTGPRHWNPRSRAFATELATAYPEPRRRIGALLEHFRRERFFYTLNPPLYGSGDARATAIDDFLFGARRGFCEHYANATAFLLRVSGIPTRVVTGYLGGEYHPAGHLIVRQSDAHAWVEAWIDGDWWRIDPTAAVAPERIEQGLQQALPETERLLVAGSRWASWALLNNAWEEASFHYTKWILGFDRDRQRELLQELGLDRMNAFSAFGWMLLAITSSGALMTLAWWLWRRHRERQLDPWRRAWQALRKRLMAAGLDLPAYVTVGAAMQRAAARWPTHAARFAAFAKGYDDARFAERPGGTAPAALLAMMPRAGALRRDTKRTHAAV